VNDPVIALPHWLGAKKTQWDEIYLPLSISSLTKSQPADREILYIDANDDFAITAGGRSTSVSTSVLGSEDIATFVDSYVHLSTNHHEFELRSILRMFYLRNLFRHLNIKSAFTVESDVLVLQDLSIMLSGFGLVSPDAALTGLKCPATAWFKQGYLEYYCDMVLTVYTGSVIKALTSWYPKYLERGGLGGICDMTFHSYAIKQEHGFSNSFVLIDSSDPIPDFSPGHNESLSFDNMLRTLSLGSHGIQSAIEPRSKMPIKSVHFDGDRRAFVLTEEGQRIWMGSLHLQGSTKGLMGRYYTDLF
jgi:hypothetical protein